MLIDRNTIDPNSCIFRGIPKEVGDCSYQLLEGAFPRMRDEERRDLDIIEVNVFTAVTKSSVPSVQFDPPRQ